MAGADPKRRKRITLKKVPPFHARGMKRVHGWRLTRWISEFSKYYIYNGEIWATKDDRLLVRFKFGTGRFCDGVDQAYEIRGMTAAEVLNLEFDPQSDEAAALQGFIISVRVPPSGHALLTQRYDCDCRFPAEENFWFPWMPRCIHRAWDEWTERIEDN